MGPPSNVYLGQRGITDNGPARRFHPAWLSGQSLSLLEAQSQRSAAFIAAAGNGLACTQSRQLRQQPVSIYRPSDARLENWQNGPGNARRFQASWLYYR